MIQSDLLSVVSSSPATSSQEKDDLRRKKLALETLNQIREVSVVSIRGNFGAILCFDDDVLEGMKYKVDYKNCQSRGTMRKIYSGTDDTQQERIVKIYKLKKLPVQLKERLMKSTKILRFLIENPNPFTVNVQNVFRTNQKLIVFMERMTGGNLMTKFKSSLQIMSQEEVLIFGKQISRALLFLHSRGIAHDNLNAHHIVFDSYGHPLLSGLDWSVVYWDSVYYRVIRQIGSSKGKIHPHFAPERLKDDFYDPSKSDVWSFGVLMLQMLTMDPLQTLTNICPDEWKEILAINGVTASSKISEVLKQCLVFDPKERKDMIEVSFTIDSSDF